MQGTPMLAAGNEVVMLLDYRTGGIPAIIPISHPEIEMYRIIPLGVPGTTGYTTAVVDGVGRVQIDAGDRMLSGPQVLTAAAEMPFEAPVNMATAASDIQDVADEVVLPSSGEPYQGVWRASAYVRLEDPATDEVLGCSASLQGEVDEYGVAVLDGRCNIPYIGSSTLTFSGAYSITGWAGDLTVTPDDDRIDPQTESVTFTEADNDRFAGEADQSDTVGSITYDTHAYLLGNFAGLRPLANGATFLSWLQDEIDASGASGGFGLSVKPDSMSCNAPLPVEVQN